MNKEAKDFEKLIKELRIITAKYLNPTYGARVSKHINSINNLLLPVVKQGLHERELNDDFNTAIDDLFEGLKGEIINDIQSIVPRDSKVPMELAFDLDTERTIANLTLFTNPRWAYEGGYYCFQANYLPTLHRLFDLLDSLSTIGKYCQVSYVDQIITIEISDIFDSLALPVWCAVRGIEPNRKLIMEININEIHA